VAGVGFDFGIEPDDLDLGQMLDKFEHLVQLRQWAQCRHLDGPGEITLAGIEFGKRRQIILMQLDRAYPAQSSQIAQKHERVRGALKDLAVGTELDAIDR
jgi:hypothetical protein